MIIDEITRETRRGGSQFKGDPYYKHIHCVKDKLRARIVDIENGVNDSVWQVFNHAVGRLKEG